MKWYLIRCCQCQDKKQFLGEKDHVEYLRDTFEEEEEVCKICMLPFRYKTTQATKKELKKDFP